MRATARHALTPTTMKSYLLLKNEPSVSLPPGTPGPDVRYPASLVEHFLREFTEEGDTVFDPFAGFGTTLQAAEAMNRIGYGTEINPQRINYARSRMAHPERLLAADVRQLAALDLPPFHFSISSPPYMGKSDEKNPLTDYSTPGKGYGQYLHDLAGVYQQVGHKMREGGHVVIEVCNLRLYDGLTTLAWDVAGEVAKKLSFQGEVVAAWESGYGFGYDHSYCLVFRK